MKPCVLLKAHGKCQNYYVEKFFLFKYVHFIQKCWKKNVKQRLLCSKMSNYSRIKNRVVHMYFFLNFLKADFWLKHDPNIFLILFSGKTMNHINCQEVSWNFLRTGCKKCYNLIFSLGIFKNHKATWSKPGWKITQSTGVILRLKSHIVKSCYLVVSHY